MRAMLVRLLISVAVATSLAPAAIAARSAVVPTLADAIAPGAYDAQVGVGPGPVAVPRGGLITYLVQASPAMPGAVLEIWTRTVGANWLLARHVRVWADGGARTYMPVVSGLEIQARLPATSAHPAASAPGRAATVDPRGRNVLRIGCGEINGLPAGSIAARSAGVTPGQIVDVEVCATAGPWFVVDADFADLSASEQSSAATGMYSVAVALHRPGFRAVRLVQRTPGVHGTVIRTLLVVLKSATLPVTVVRNIAMTPLVACGSGRTCVVPVDVFAPKPAGPWPVVVLLRGGPGGIGARTVYDQLAQRLASYGAVVYNADYRDNPSSGSQYPRAFDDAACAVRFARLTASDYGGRPGYITLVGHSLGAYVGSIVALSDDSFASSCVAAGAGRPNAFVGISGPYRLTAPNLQADFASVLGGTRAQAPYAWRHADPLAFASRHTEVRIRLIHGSDDPTVETAASAALERALTARGFDTALMTVAGGTHVSVIASAKGGEWATAMIEAALR